MAVATARPNWRDAVLGGKQGTLPELGGNRNLPEYGPFSSRVVYPTGKYLFSPSDELPPRVGRARKMTASDFQIVSLYSDLSRRDIGYLQSIARIYDVTQMRELIQCRLNNMGKKRRCLDVTRHEDFDAYKGYLDKKYGKRMPELMPMIHAHPRPPRVWPRVTEYPVIHSHPRLRHSARKDPRLVALSHADVSKEEEIIHKDSIVTMQGSDPDGAKLPRKTSFRKEKVAGKPARIVQKPEAVKIASKTVHKSEMGVPSGVSYTSKDCSSKTTTAAQRKSHPRKTATKEQVTEVNRLEGMLESGFESRGAEGSTLVASSKDDGAKLDRLAIGHKAASRKNAEKELSSGKGGEILSHSGEDANEKLIEYVDMFCSPTATEDAIIGASSLERKGVEAKDRDKDEGPGDVEKVVSGDVVKDESIYADDKFEEPTGSDEAGTSEEPTPEVAKSVSLEGFQGVFSPEYDDVPGQSVSGKGQAEVRGDSAYQEDVDDKPADNSQPDELADEMNKVIVKEMENSASLTPLWLFKDDPVQALPTETPPNLANEFLVSVGSASPADDEYSKDQHRITDEYVLRQVDLDQQQEQIETPKTQEPVTTSGHKEGHNDDVIHKSSSSVGSATSSLMYSLLASGI